MKNSLISILSACSTHQCLAFASSAFSGRLVSSSSDDVLPHASSARWSCSKAPGRRHRPHQRRQRSLLRAAEEEGGGVAEGGDGAGDVNGGAGSGMGLDGEWQVKSGRVSSKASTCTALPAFCAYMAYVCRRPWHNAIEASELLTTAPCQVRCTEPTGGTNPASM